ncbi:MAG: hypothetical protein L0H64_24100 [Pseudonocardia sp.]|nr:hypothetical protein [Pseudonocardia sp.]
MKRGELRGRISTKPGLHRYLRVTPGGLLRVDEAKCESEANLDGKYLLRCSDPHHPVLGNMHGQRRPSPTSGDPTVRLRRQRLRHRRVPRSASRGRDYRSLQDPGAHRGVRLFSKDRFAIGLDAGAAPIRPARAGGGTAYFGTACAGARCARSAPPPPPGAWCPLARTSRP